MISPRAPAPGTGRWPIRRRARTRAVRGAFPGWGSRLAGRAIGGERGLTDRHRHIAVPGDRRVHRHPEGGRRAGLRRGRRRLGAGGQGASGGGFTATRRITWGRGGGGGGGSSHHGGRGWGWLEHLQLDRGPGRHFQRGCPAPTIVAARPPCRANANSAPHSSGLKPAMVRLPPIVFAGAPPVSCGPAPSRPAFDVDGEPADARALTRSMTCTTLPWGRPCRRR